MKPFRTLGRSSSKSSTGTTTTTSTISVSRTGELGAFPNYESTPTFPQLCLVRQLLGTGCDSVSGPNVPTGLMDGASVLAGCTKCILLK